MKSLEPYNKAIVALVGVGLMLLSQKYGATSVFQYITGGVTVLGVLHIRNGVVQELVDDVETAVDDLPADKPAVATSPSVLPPAAA